jgi:hypothetical protein
MTSNKYAKAIFERFAILYGRQKTQAMFGLNPEDMAMASEAWEQQLRETDPNVIRAVLSSLATAKREWPPSLSEWVGLCQEHNRPEHRLALPEPRPEPTEFSRAMQQEMRNIVVKPGYDYMHWAKYPGSAKAVELLVRGAKTDRRLADILQHLIATDGRDCRREDARAAIRKLSPSVRSEMAFAQD